MEFTIMARGSIRKITAERIAVLALCAAPPKISTIEGSSAENPVDGIPDQFNGFVGATSSYVPQIRQVFVE
jgi:hypothetical protein